MSDITRIIDSSGPSVARALESAGFTRSLSMGGQVRFERGSVRVCPTAEDGTSVYVFRGRLGYVMGFEMAFSGGTPPEVILAAALAAVHAVR